MSDCNESGEGRDIVAEWLPDSHGVSRMSSEYGWSLGDCPKVVFMLSKELFILAAATSGGAAERRT
jgi:hypothetical protein